MDISHTAKLLYALLLDRSTLSQKNGWQDSEGRTYIVYPIAEIAEMLDKGCTTIKSALNELDAAGLLERRRTGFSAANRLYVKVPPIPVVQFSDQLTDGKPTLIRAGNRPAGLLERRRTGFSAANRLYVKVPPIPVVQFSDQLTDGKPTLIRAGNRPTDSRKTDLMTVGKPSPNQTNINNLTESQTKGASEGQPPAAYGRYKNVFLSDTELLELEKDFPGKWEYYLDRLSCHIASTGKQYHSHAATIYKWAQEDAAKEKELEKDFPGKWEYYLDRLSCHIASTGKQYHSHAATIYKWAQEDAAKEKPKKGIPDYSFKEGESL